LTHATPRDPNPKPPYPTPPADARRVTYIGERHWYIPHGRVGVAWPKSDGDWWFQSDDGVAPTVVTPAEIESGRRPNGIMAIASAFLRALRR
jgi:hypothetical protein